MKRHPFFYAASAEMLARSLDRSAICVDAVDKHLWVCACDRDVRAAVTAGAISYPGGRVRLEAGVNLLNRRQPFVPEQPLEHRTSEASLTLMEVLAVVGARDAVAAPEHLEERIEWAVQATTSRPIGAM